MPVRLFTFVQMELPWQLGPADGRYLLRKPTGAAGNEPQHVVVLSTVGAERRGLLGGRSRTRRAESAPAPVPVTRATVVDPVALSLDTQARKWLQQLDPEREAQAAATVLNRVLWAHRIAGAEAYVHEISPSQALVLRAGYGEGEQVADGLWSDARELVLSHKRSGRRATVLRPQERLALLLSGRGEVLLCEELVLRARVDLNAGRLALAAIELERAYATALVELGAEQRADMRARLEELEELRAEVEATAHAAVPKFTPKPADKHSQPTTPDTHSQTTTPDGRPHSGHGPGILEEQTVRHALERLEAALRARTAAGFTVQ